MYNKILNIIDRIYFLSNGKIKRTKSSLNKSSRKTSESVIHYTPQRQMPDQNPKNIPFNFTGSSQSKSEKKSEEKRLSIEEDKYDDNVFYERRPRSKDVKSDDKHDQLDDKHDESDENPDDSDGSFVRKKPTKNTKPAQEKPKPSLIGGNMPSRF